MPTEVKNRTLAIVNYPGVALLDFVVTQTVLNRGIRYRTFSVRERTETIIDYDPQLPFGGMNYDHLGAMSAVTAGLSLVAPVIAAKPK